MPWEKSPADLVDRFGTVLERRPELERRKMFGYPAAFLGGHMVTSLYQSSWVARVGDPAAADDPGIRAAEPFEPMVGRPMKGFVVVPPSIVADDAAIDRWLDSAVAHVRTLPPKK